MDGTSTSFFFPPIYSIHIMKFTPTASYFSTKLDGYILKLSNSLTVTKITLRNHKGRILPHQTARIIVMLCYLILYRN